MNKDRRKDIKAIVADMTLISDRIQDVIDEEEEYLGNMPDGIRDSDKGEISEEYISIMEEAISEIYNISTTLEEI